jgi:hypothetical protein
MAEWTAASVRDRRPVLGTVGGDRLAEAKRLAESIEHAVWQQTGGAVLGLRVEVTPVGVFISGHCHSYYAKQKAQHAAMECSGGRSLTNLIDVT